MGVLSGFGVYHRNVSSGYYFGAYLSCVASHDMAGVRGGGVDLPSESLRSEERTVAFGLVFRAWRAWVFGGAWRKQHSVLDDSGMLYGIIGHSSPDYPYRLEKRKPRRTTLVGTDDVSDVVLSVRFFLWSNVCLCHTVTDDGCGGQFGELAHCAIGVSNSRTQVVYAFIGGIWPVVGPIRGCFVTIADFAYGYRRRFVGVYLRSFNRIHICIYRWLVMETRHDPDWRVCCVTRSFIGLRSVKGVR